MSEEATILVGVDGGVATVTLNRPEQRNAISLGMEQELHDAMWGLEADEAVRAIVVTGAGKGFCSGVDISDPAAFGAAAHEEHDRELGVTSETVGERVAYWKMATPVIGAINGAAIGAGLTLPLLFDIRFVAEDAKLSFVFTRRGILPEANSTWLLSRLVGVERALDLLLSGRTFSGAEAVEIGLATRALPAPEVLPAAQEFARDLAVNTAPASVATAKRLVYENLAVTDRMASMGRETRLTWWLGEQPDALEGVMAFMEKRDPKWTASKHLRPPDDAPA
jgi:enoyl-CoA hydratase/carnithine racemase